MTGAMLCGASSRGQGDRASMRRLGAGGDIVAPRFLPRYDPRGEGVVELDLSKARAAMKFRGVAVGRFFSPLPYHNEELFGELKGKWGLHGGMDYKPLKNNRFLIEFEREGDRRFILNNGPWTHQGDAFLMVTVDGGAPPGEVEVAHMPIWVRVHDVPPIMLDEGVAWKLGGERGAGGAGERGRSGKHRLTRPGSI